MKLETTATRKYAGIKLEFKVPLTKKTVRLYAGAYNTPDQWTNGYSSRCKDGMFVLFHDYDELSESDVVNELRAMQKMHKIGNYYLFKTDRDNSFHAVCLDKFSLAEAYSIQKTTSSDFAFIESVKRLAHKEWVLRYGEKGSRGAPEYLQTIVSKYQGRKKSSAHADFLKAQFGIKTPGYNWDGLTELKLVDYTTCNRTESNNKRLKQ